MSNLTVGLAILGGIVLIVLVAHSAWTSRRSTPLQPDAPPPSDAVRSTPDEPREPREPREPTFDPELVPVAAPAIDRKGTLDPLIDVIAAIEVDHPVSGEAALAALPTTRRAGGKPFAVEGLRQDDGEWETPAPGRRYSAFQAGVQLANRTGPLNEIEYSEFVVKAQAFADAINGAPDFPDMLDAVARGRELDQFAGSHDAQLGVTLRARNAAWSPGYVQQHASRLGFVPGVLPGRLVLPASVAGAPPVLALAFDSQAALADDPAQAAIRDITLSLDVPQVERGEQPFVRMRDTAISLAAAMDGSICDDNGQVIGPQALDAIGADLEHLYDALAERDLAAGSPQARRLFS